MKKKELLEGMAVYLLHQSAHHKGRDRWIAEQYSCCWQQGTSKQSLIRHVH